MSANFMVHNHALRNGVNNKTKHLFLYIKRGTSGERHNCWANEHKKKLKWCLWNKVMNAFLRQRKKKWMQQNRTWHTISKRCVQCALCSVIKSCIRCNIVSTCAALFQSAIVVFLVNGAKKQQIQWQNKNKLQKS